MTNPWFKFYAGEYLSDTKMLQLNAQERSCWVTLLCLANQSEGGVVKFLNQEQLIILSGVIGELPNVLEKFESLGMIDMSNGKVTVRNWEKRQMSEGYFRQKEFKKRKSNGKVTHRIEENRKEEKRIDKNTYGEFSKVLLSSDTGIESKGYKYNSHYATILNWARRKYTEHVEKKLLTKTRTIANL